MTMQINDVKDENVNRFISPYINNCITPKKPPSLIKFLYSTMTSNNVIAKSLIIAKNLVYLFTYNYFFVGYVCCLCIIIDGFTPL